jgi:uncharacterized membrane protein YedE/YeeE
MTWLLDTFMWPVIGGALIGLSAALLMLLNGRIAGVSGIFGGALQFPEGDSAWRWSFVLGLAAGGISMLWAAGPALFENTLDMPIGVVAVAGLLVGFGTRLGSGCTSGHGICGLARYSPRSLVSVITFILSGAVVVYVARHVLGA